MKLFPAALALFAVALCASFFGAQAATDTEPHAPRTVFLLRHAEAHEATTENRDPGLTEVGLVRSQALAALLAPTGVTHLGHSPYARTRETLAPLAAAADLEPGVLDPMDLGAWSDWIASTPPGSVLVIAGHSNTVPALLDHLGGDASGVDLHRGGPERRLHHDRYDRLFQLVIPHEAPEHPLTLELAIP